MRVSSSVCRVIENSFCCFRKQKRFLRKMYNLTVSHNSDDCSNERLMLNAGVPFRGSVSFDRWNYYTVNVQNNALQIIVNETFNNYAIGLVWVYARRVTPDCAKAADGHCLPTTRIFNYANISVTSEHVLYIPSNEANGTWNIGVTGSAAESARVDANYV